MSDLKEKYEKEFKKARKLCVMQSKLLADWKDLNAMKKANGKPVLKRLGSYDLSHSAGTTDIKIIRENDLYLPTKAEDVDHFVNKIIYLNDASDTTESILIEYGFSGSSHCKTPGYFSELVTTLKKRDEDDDSPYVEHITVSCPDEFSQKRINVARRCMDEIMTALGVNSPVFALMFDVKGSYELHFVFSCNFTDKVKASRLPINYPSLESKDDFEKFSDDVVELVIDAIYAYYERVCWEISMSNSI